MIQKDFERVTKITLFARVTSPVLVFFVSPGVSDGSRGHRRDFLVFFSAGCDKGDKGTITISGEHF